MSNDHDTEVPKAIAEELRSLKWATSALQSEIDSLKFVTMALAGGASDPEKMLKSIALVREHFEAPRQNEPSLDVRMFVVGHLDILAEHVRDVNELGDEG